MSYGPVMEYLSSALDRMRLKTRRLSAADALTEADLGLRSMLGLPGEYENLQRVLFHWSRPQTVYKMMDAFLCHYIFIPLPPGEDGQVLLIGPYLTGDLSHEEILEQAERVQIPLQYASRMSNYYAALPVFADTSMLMALVSSLGEVLWGSVEAFETVDMNTAVSPSVPHEPEGLDGNSLKMQMTYIQTRYDYEDKLIEAVARGQIQHADLLTSGISQLNFEQRMADPLRNMKNYCIICNTLLRKAAQQGGVHPLHIDRLSSKYAQLIENKATTESCQQLIGDMFRSYSRLVRSHSVGRYSVPVQKMLLYIEENLSGELSLQAIAASLELSPGYLSGLFHRETGKTVTAHVNELRMRHAMHLLTTTQLQVQNVAQLCGVPDANYFSKLFRKHYGITPRHYRRSLTPMG